MANLSAETPDQIDARGIMQETDSFLRRTLLHLAGGVVTPGASILGVLVILGTLLFVALIGRALEDRRVSSELGFDIDQRFRSAATQVPFPQRDLHVKALPARTRPGQTAGCAVRW